MPEPGATPTIVDVILCHDATVSSDEHEPNEVRTFQYADMRFEPATGNVFAIGDTITVFAQAVSTSAGMRTIFELRSGDDVLDTHTGALIGELSTLGLVGGEYEVRAQLVGDDGTVFTKKPSA